MVIVIIDNSTKDGGPGLPNFCVAITMNLCVLELKQALIRLLFEDIQFDINTQALRGCLKLPCEFQFHALKNTEVSAAKDHG